MQQATTGAAFATDKLGLTNVQIYPDQGDMFTALRAGQIDAAMTDTSIVLAEEEEHGRKVTWWSASTRPARAYGAIYEKGSANTATIDKIIQSMIDDGTMSKLGDKYLAAVWGKDPAPSSRISNNIRLEPPRCSRGFLFAPRPNIERTENCPTKLPMMRRRISLAGRVVRRPLRGGNLWRHRSGAHCAAEPRSFTGSPGSCCLAPSCCCLPLTFYSGRSGR